MKRVYVICRVCGGSGTLNFKYVAISDDWSQLTDIPSL